MTTDTTSPANGTPTPEATSQEVQATPAPAAAQAQPSAETQPTPSSTDLGSEEQAKPEGTDLGAEPEAEAEPEAPPYAAFHGVPEGEYEDFILPDGAAADSKLADEFRPFAKELGLSQAGAQKLVEFKTKLDQRNLEIWHEHVSDLKAQAQAHPEIGGGKYNEAVAYGRQAIAKFGTPGLRAMMNNYGVGAHPEMILFMSRIGRAVGETPALGNGGSGGHGQKPLHEILYKDS
jgi:hypothetical protein